MVNCKHELALPRSKNAINAIVQTEAEEFKINYIKIEWFMPYVVLSYKHKIHLHYLVTWRMFTTLLRVSESGFLQ